MRWAATFIERNLEGSYDVRYDLEPHIPHCLPPDDIEDTLLVVSIAPMRDVGPLRSASSRLPPLGAIQSTSRLVTPDVVIRFDGGHNRATKVSSAAVSAQVFVPGRAEPVLIEAYRYWIGGTNNCAEHLALVGAMRLAHLLFSGRLVFDSPISNIAILGDSDLAIGQALKLKTVRSAHLKPMVDIERDMVLRLAFAPDKWFGLFHVLRQYNSQADALGRRCTLAASSLDPHELFKYDVTLFADSLGGMRDDVDDEADDAAPPPIGDAGLPAGVLMGDIVELQSSFSVAELCYLRTFPTLDSIPLEAGAAWASLVLGQLSAVLGASSDALMAASFSRLLALPTLFLPAHLSISRLALLLCERRPCVRKPAGIEHSAADRAGRVARRALNFARRGFLRQAMKCLAPSPCADVSVPAVLAKLESKYPKLPGPTFAPGPSHPRVADLGFIPLFPPKIVLEVMSKMNAVAASGMDRWNSSLLKTAHHHSSEILSAVSRLLHLMLTRWQVFEPFCVIGRGVALVKNETDVRPIGIGCFFVKLLSAVCLKLDDPADVLPTWQHGLAKNGCFRVIRDVRAHHEASDYVVTIDAENAHNSVSRQACWDALSKRPERLRYCRAFFRLAYGSDTRIFYQKRGNDWHEVTSNVGVRQGCGIACTAYNLATCDALEPVIENLAPGDHVYALHDDISATSPSLARIIAGFDASVAALSALGLKVNPSKCEILLPASITLDDRRSATALAGTRGLLVVAGDSSSIKILGAHIGCDATATAFIGSKLEITIDLIRSVAATFGTVEPRAAIALLRFCCEPKLLYRFTCHKPSLCLSSALAYDAEILESLRSFLGADISRDLVVSSYGLKFSDYQKALPLLYDKFLSNTRDLGGGLKVDLLAEQRATHDSFLLAKHPLLKARLVAQGCAASGSIGWSSPFVPLDFAAHPRDVILFLRQLLLCDTRSVEPCFCGEYDRGDGLFLIHVLSCSHVRGAGRTYRHNSILAVMDHYIRRMGVLTAVEPTFYVYDDGSKKRPDLTAFVAHPVATDLVVSVDPESALEEKLEKHGAAVYARGHAFIPCAMSAFGELHPSVDKFLSLTFAGLTPPTRVRAILLTKRAMSEAWLLSSAAIIRGVAARDLVRDSLPFPRDDAVEDLAHF